MSIFQGVGNRGGTRGGKDLFNWDDVRDDKYKDYYLGQSLHLQTGSGWWVPGKLQTANGTGPPKTQQPTKQKKDQTNDALDAQKQKEFLQIKKQEQELMMEALGLAPKRRRESGKKLEKFEFKELCRRGSTVEDEEDAASRIPGLGFAPPQARAALEGNLPSGEGDDLEQVVMTQSSTTSTIQSNTNKDKKTKKHKKDKKEKKEKKREKKEKKEKRKYSQNDNNERHSEKKMRTDSEDRHSNRERNRNRDGDKDPNRNRGNDMDRNRDRNRDRDRDRDRDNRTSNNHPHPHNEDK